MQLDIKFLLFLCGTLSACLLTQTAVCAERPLVVIQKMLGEARVTRDNNTVMGKAKMILQKGDRISVGKRSSVIIRFADGSEHTLLQNSDVIVQDVLSVDDGSEFNLVSTLKMLRGKVRYYFKPRQSRKHSRVKTHNATLGVRGTKFFVDNQDEVNTHVVVFSGEVEATSELAQDGANRTVSVRPGEYSRISGEQVPTEPLVLSAAQLDSVLTGEDPESTSFAEETLAESGEDSDHIAEAELHLRIATAADFVYNPNDNHEEPGGGLGLQVRFFPLGESHFVSFGLQASVSSFEENADTEVFRVGATLGASLISSGFDWLSMRIQVGVGVTRLQNLSNQETNSSELSPDAPRPQPVSNTQFQTWEKNENLAYVEPAFHFRIPAQTAFAGILGLSAPRVINPENYKTVELTLGLVAAF